MNKYNFLFLFIFQFICIFYNVRKNNAFVFWKKNYQK